MIFANVLSQLKTIDLKGLASQIVCLNRREVKIVAYDGYWAIRRWVDLASMPLRPAQWDRWLNGVMEVGGVWPILANHSVGEEMAGWLKKRANSPDQRALLVALMAAQASPTGDVVRGLLACGASAKNTNPQGRTALMWAAQKGFLDCVKELLPHSDARAADDHGATALMDAASMGAFSCLSELLAQSDASMVDVYGRNALMFAGRAGCEKSVRALLPLCDPRKKDKENMTALMWAVRADSLEGVKALLPVSDAKAVDKNGNDALALAERHNCWAAADALAPLAGLQRAKKIYEKQARWARIGGTVGVPPKEHMPDTKAWIRAAMEQEDMQKMLAGEKPSHSASQPNLTVQAERPQTNNQKRSAARL